MSAQALAEKRGARSLKRRQKIAGRMKVFGVPYIPDVKTKRAVAVINFKGYKEPGRVMDVLPPVPVPVAPKMGLWQRFVRWFTNWKAESEGDLIG